MDYCAEYSRNAYRGETEKPPLVDKGWLAMLGWIGLFVINGQRFFERREQEE